MAFTVKPEAEEELRDKLGEILDAGDGWAVQEHGFSGYSRCEIGPGGARLAYHESGPERERMGIHVQLPGQACGLAGTERLHELIKWAATVEANVTRIDLAMDDHERRVTPGDVLEAWRSGEVITRAKRIRRQEEEDREGKVTGTTVYMGRGGSERMMRVYDKALERGEETGPIRWELQNRKKAAAAVAAAIARTELEGLGELAARFLVGFCDFRKTGSNKRKNKERRTRVDWFRALVGDVTRAAITEPERPRSFAEVYETFKRQQAGIVAVIVDGHGYDPATLPEPFRKIYDQGVKRRKQRHARILRTSPLAGIAAEVA